MCILYRQGSAILYVDSSLLLVPAIVGLLFCQRRPLVVIRGFLARRYVIKLREVSRRRQEAMREFLRAAAIAAEEAERQLQLQREEDLRQAAEEARLQREEGMTLQTFALNNITPEGIRGQSSTSLDPWFNLRMPG